MFSPFLILLFLHVCTYTVMGQKNYHIDPTCIPLCDANSKNPNIPGNPPCLCNPTFHIPGCTVAPCGPGDDSSDVYTCQCTEYFQPISCVTLRCDNGTTAVPSSCPSSNYPSSNYPSSNYFSSNYPSSDYLSSNYPSSNYPSSNYPSSNYPSSNYQSFDYHSRNYPPPNYPSYSYPSPSPYSCNNYCSCEPYQPSECTDESIPPILGGPPCACNMDFWPTGCTLKACQTGDLADNAYFCECTPTHSPDFCYMPRCSPKI